MMMMKVEVAQPVNVQLFELASAKRKMITIVVG